MSAGVSAPLFYVNPAVSPSQVAAQAWPISLIVSAFKCPESAHQVWVLTTLSTWAISPACKPEAVPGKGSGNVQSATCLDHGNCLYAAFVEQVLYLHRELVHSCQAVGGPIHGLGPEEAPMQLLRTVEMHVLKQRKKPKNFCLSASVDIITVVWMLA